MKTNTATKTKSHRDKKRETKKVTAIIMKWKVENEKESEECRHG